MPSPHPSKSLEALFSGPQFLVTDHQRFLALQTLLEFREAKPL